MKNKYCSPAANEASMSITKQTKALDEYNKSGYAAYAMFTCKPKTNDTILQCYTILNERCDELKISICNMVTEMQGSFISYEESNAFIHEMQTAKFAGQYLQPVLVETSKLLNEIANVFKWMPVQHMNETELEYILDEMYRRCIKNLSPAQEFFVKAMHNKAKAVAKVTCLFNIKYKARA